MIAALVGASILLVIGLSFYLKSDNNPEPVVETKTVNSVNTGAKTQDDPCLNPKYETERLEMKDGYMKGLIEIGTKYTAIKGWYRCNPVKRGDIVFYRYNSNFPPVPRLVHAIPGDKFKLVQDKKRKAWNLAINGKVVTNHDGEEPHYFGNETAAPILSLYEKTMKGVLVPSTYVIFSTVSPGSQDSELGVVNSEDFVGRVEVSERTEIDAPTKIENPKKVDTGPKKKVDLKSSKQVETEASEKIDTQPE